MPQVKARGLSFEYDIAGPEQGEPLMLVMGFGTQMTAWPDSFRDRLADEGYRVIRFDNRDIGLSHQFDDHAPPDLAKVIGAITTGQDASAHVPYLLEEMAADAAAILEELDMTPAHVMGASMGGMIVQLMALNHREHVRSIIPTMTTSGDPTLPQATPAAMEALITPPASDRREDVVARAVKSRGIIGSVDGVRDSDDLLAQRAGEAYDRAYRPLGVARQYGAILAQPRWHERLADVDVPALVLHGANDPLIPPAGGRDVAKRISGAKHVEIEGWGHDFPSAMMDKVANELIAFLKTVD